MKKNKSLLYVKLLVLVFAFAKAESQQSNVPLLTRQMALDSMLQNNYGIIVARNQVEIADNNAGLLNSGYLPTLQGTANAEYQLSDNRTDFGGAENQQGEPREPFVQNDAETRSYSAAINANYLLFDGLGRYYNFKILQEQYELSQLQVRSTIETTGVQLMSVYLQIARLKENLATFEQSLEINKQRETRAQYQFEYGQVNKLEVLNARVDINTDSINILNTRQQLRNTKRDLNLLLNRDFNQQFTVDTTVTLQNLLVIDSFVEQAQENNVRLLQAEQNVTISDYDIKVARSLLLPRIGLTGSYGWNRRENPGSAFFPDATTTNTSKTLAVGANLTWDIFDGGRSINSIRNAMINLDNEQLLKKQTIDEVTRDVLNARGNYANALRIFEMQEQNLVTNTDNFNRTQERFKLGQATSIEFRQAQLNLINAQTTKTLAKYDAKLAEYQLLQLTGQFLNVSL
ncbi:TolC family protein [Nonlabens ponticola]|uniref:TolC family protein n=1 Tax=Nonlabens ponticola TaxID=2496866 RepID=A0A3S9MU62_9FLAO|nr:TolC family protein [Nonlabens ponticola]AZQ42719.1 TolC family protein [Nonlabens ponticola]